MQRRWMYAYLVLSVLLAAVAYDAYGLRGWWFAVGLALGNAALWTAPLRFPPEGGMGGKHTRHSEMPRFEPLAKQVEIAAALDLNTSPSPAQKAYEDACRLLDMAWFGTPLTRRQAGRHPQWTEYRWRQAHRFARRAGVIDRDQAMLVDSYEAARALLHEQRLEQAELAAAGRWVGP